MSKFWRVIAPIVAAGGLVAAGAIPAASASPTDNPAYSVSIASKATFAKISGHTLVFYKTKGYRTATIGGTVFGAVLGDIATLWSKPFGAKAFAATTSTVTLTPDGETPTQSPYTFSVIPSQATAYEVVVTTGITVQKTSAAVTVYVAKGTGFTNKRNKCTHTTCTFSYKVWQYVPAAAYKTEARKTIYLYLAVGYPNLPARYTLDKSAKASKVRKINSGVYEFTATFYVTLHRGGANWATAFCTRDTESKDGLGLPPGNHGCGDKHISIKTRYIG
jgi:hypothetical protein